MKAVVRSFEASAVLFDLDGVMIHSKSSIERAWRAWSSAHHLPWEDVAPLVPGRQAVDTIRALLPDLAGDEVEREAEKVNKRQVSDTSDVERVAGVYELVMALPDQRWAVVTACPRELAEARLRATGYPIPVVLITADVVISGKPDPQGYRLAAKRLGIAYSRCLVIEDSPAGIAAAKAAGMAVIALTTTHEPADLIAADALVQDATWLSTIVTV